MINIDYEFGSAISIFCGLKIDKTPERIKIYRVFFD